MVTICRSWHLSLWTMFIKQNNLPIFHHSTRNNPLITSSHRCFTLSFTAERFINEYSSDQLNYFRICYIAFNLIPKGFGKSSDKNWISATKKAWENGKIRQGMVRTSTRTIPRRVIRKILITWQHCRFLFSMERDDDPIRILRDGEEKAIFLPGGDCYINASTSEYLDCGKWRPVDDMSALNKLSLHKGSTDSYSLKVSSLTSTVECHWYDTWIEAILAVYTKKKLRRGCDDFVLAEVLH